MSNEQPYSRLARKARQRFEQRFGRPPRWVVAAPGRVNLIGEHTDYNDGFVFPMAIERYVVIAADRPSDASDLPTDEALLVSTQLDAEARVRVAPPVAPQAEATWTSYVQGALAGCLDAGLEPGSFEALIHADVPLGGGLSSSAALEVATATLVEAITGRKLDKMQKVLLCQKAEHDYAHMPCGIMDQFSSVMGQQGHLMLLDCRAREAQLVPLSDPDTTVLIANTNVKHELVGGEYAERRGQCEEVARRFDVPALRDLTLTQLDDGSDRLDEVHLRRARHVIGENERTTQAAEVIRNGGWDRLGALMYASHESLRDDYEVSCPELDAMVELARSVGPDGGVIGSRMTGGGFGGCTVSLVRRQAIDDVAARLRDGYHRHTGIEPTIFASRPAPGACIVEAHD